MLSKRTFADLAIAAGLFAIMIGPALLVYDDVRRMQGIGWAASIGFLSLSLVLLQPKRGVRSMMFIGFGLTLLILNLVLVVCFAIQGVAFNRAFFSHLDITTLDIAWRTDRARMVALAVYFVVAATAVIWVSRRALLESVAPRLARQSIGIAAAIAAVAISYPIQSLANYYIKNQQTSERMEAELLRLTSAPRTNAPVESGAYRNLVLIYLESVERNYTDQELFPGLLPNLSEGLSPAIRFSNVHQYPGTGWTIGGIVSSQCGVPLLSERLNGNIILQEKDNPFSGITCLGEYLQEAGYATAFIQGATLEFAGKGNFLRDNGFDVVLGLDELPDSATHRWGMFDTDVYNLAEDLYDGLAQDDRPFLLSVLTLDTHHPTGFPSPGCEPYGDGTSIMLTAVSCADKLVTDFLEHIRQSPAAGETVVAIMSDHLLLDGGPKPTLQQKERGILFLILDPSLEESRTVDAPAAHFDIGPTILEAVGLEGATFAFGQSLLSHDQGKVFERNLTEDDFAAFSVERLTNSH